MSDPIDRNRNSVVLIVDDDPTVRFLVRETLEPAGFVVEEASDGAQALGAWERVRPDLVLLDVHLPGIDGFAVCARLRASPLGTSVPVVMVTGLDDIESIDRAYDSGATDFITKPINWPLLAHRVRYVHRTSKSEIALRKSEDQLRQALKMEAIGRLAGGIAHDFNNVLAVILGQAELLLTALPDGDPRRRRVESIHQAADRAATLTRQLLAFSRKQLLQPRLLDLNNVVGRIVLMLKSLLGEDIELVVKTAAEVAPAKADPGQLDQVVLNLALNARDAMPQGGQLTLETADVELDEMFARRNPGAYPGQYVMLAVSDTGVGMDADTRAHLFEPFFTTKEMGKGTGLGLATVYGIVKQSDGYIRVESELGRGSRFTVYLPRAEGIAEASETRRPPAERPRGSATVLVVEDQHAVGDLVVEMLESMGYTVRGARHGAEALEISGTHQGRIDLLLTDVVMPKMSGVELAARMRLWHPEMRVLYMSGHAEDAALRLGVRSAEAAFLQKPFTLDALTRKVNEVLDGQRQPAQGPADTFSGPPRRSESSTVA